jgi:hypothetical protein
MSVVPATAGNWSEARTKEILHAPPDTVSFAVTPDGQSFLILAERRHRRVEPGRICGWPLVSSFHPYELPLLRLA